ncbi:tetratricopeptide repeat protein [Capnocytophaga sp.]|uniref:tetratricopeptide repeat protein n=1 Tax=Capnocytophaga sp. TaxID=44737 RepID=UPI0026DBC47C|nr:tetratricopeptide repeat protein [Capnocytophaga sp.]MDO5105687.1 tetratricopeptide repeat protein [Capnocytophaga sp.]
MNFFSEEENFSVSKFESMLQKNHILFFDVDEFEQIVEHYLELGKMNKAKHALQIGLNQHPTAVSLKLLRVEVLIFEDELQQASLLLNELELIEPSNSEVYVQRANLYSKLNNHQRAIELLKYALPLTDDLVDIYSLIAMEYLFMENYTKAKKYFKKCLSEDIEDYMSLQQLLFCYDILEENDEAIAFLNAYLDKNPYCEVAWYYLGKQHLVRDDFSEALRCFDFAIISDDTFTGAYFEKAKVLEKLEKYQKAIENYKITLTLDDASPLVYLHIGRCFEKMNDDEKAEQYYYKAVHEDPQLSKSWMTLADFYYLRGNHTKALKHINKVLHIEDNNPYYWRRCAEINFCLNDWERAEYAFSQAVHHGDYSLNTLANWADLLLLIGNYEKTLQVASETNRLFADDVTTLYRLAIANAGMKNYYKSKYYLKKAIENGKEWVAFFDKKFPAFFGSDFVKEILLEA